MRIHVAKSRIITEGYKRNLDLRKLKLCNLKESNPKYLILGNINGAMQIYAKNISLQIAKNCLSLKIN